MNLEQTRKLVNGFRYAIFFRLKVPPETIAGTQRTPKQIKQSRLTDKTRLEILSKIESEAFYDGYYLAVGFGGGPCKRVLCPNEECQALKPGQGCKFPLHARSAMEGVGMDVYLMATKVGWDIYPLGGKPPPPEVPHGTQLGIVFIY